MKKGDTVLFTQYVIAHTNNKGNRTLFINQILPTEGILLGYSFLRTGNVEWDSDGFGYHFCWNKI